MNISKYFPALCLLLCACGGKPAGDRPQAIRIGYIGGHSQAAIIQQLGWFEEEFGRDSIRVTLQRFDYGPPEIEAFLAGDLDFGTVGDQPAIVGWAKGVDIKAIGSISGGYRLFGLVAGDASGIRSTKDLKGKKVAVAAGTSYQHLLYLYLQEAGLEKADIQAVNLKFSESVTALASGDVDAAVLGEPFLSLVENRQLGKVVAFSDGLKYAVVPIVAAGDFLEKYPAIALRLLKLYDRANRWGLANRDSAIAIYRRDVPFLPHEVVEALYDKNPANIALNDTMIHALRDTYGFLVQEGIVPGDRDISGFYDDGFGVR
ncbi:MAG: aliphatic sulfonate ABC transporter substrate-binding protein [Tannerella sp.]|jgi:sulfonate transport system substrate-binding protein|nr:aliphatic sulfonate ABC transporter substrate-binding protein [Tannerella sp.]